MKEYPPAVVEVTRGAFVESMHRVDIVVADADGHLVEVWGEGARRIFPRSSVKSLQALPLVESGAADAYKFDAGDLALACSSHNAESAHVLRAGDMLAKSGNTPICLECGAQLPRRFKDQIALKNGPSRIHNPCSGKHAGFLAFARHAGYETSGYTRIDHPVQREVAGVLEAVTASPHNKENHGVDGCSIPTFLMPLDKLAIAYARFGVGQDPDPRRAEAMLRIRDACLQHPDMVAGSKRACTDLMKALGNRAFVKFGAEGVYVASLPELGAGVAMKARDGSARAVELAIAATISRLLKLSDDESNKMRPMLQPTIKDRNGAKVGVVRIAL